MKTDMNRRQALAGLAAGSAGAGLGLPSAAAEQPAATTAPAAQPHGACVLFPQAVEGPYYFDPKLMRLDITEGKPGLPLALTLKIIDSATCAPVPDIRVDIWHADAAGVYSGYSGQGDRRDVSTKGQTYLRGTQVTDVSGNVSFRSVYPGWYPGRTPHIHVKAFLGEKTMVTGQAYFPDEVTERIYRTQAPYSARPKADTTNSSDFIFKSGVSEGGGIVLAIEEKDGLITAGLVIAIDRSGAASARSGSAGGFWRWLWGRE